MAFHGCVRGQRIRCVWTDIHLLAASHAELKETLRSPHQIRRYVCGGGGGWAPIQQLVSNLLLWNQDLVHIPRIAFFSLFASKKRLKYTCGAERGRIQLVPRVRGQLPARTSRRRFKTLGGYLETAADGEAAS